MTITPSNVEALLDAGRLQVQMAHGAWWAIRRNGATRRWKRDPARFYIPYKAGLKVYGNITQDDFHNGALHPAYRIAVACDSR